MKPAGNVGNAISKVTDVVSEVAQSAVVEKTESLVKELVYLPVTACKRIYELNKPRQRGGEGIERQIRNRRAENEEKKWFKDEGYWMPTLFAARGRAFPVKPLLTYMLYCTGIAAAVIYGMDTYQQETYAAGLANVQGMLGAVLGLLLAFRMNQAYSRWWDGRKAWETVRNGCVNIARDAYGYLDNDMDLAKKIVSYTAVFPHILKCHLQKSKDLLLEGSLSEDERQKLEQAKHMPLHVLGQITKYLAKVVRTSKDPAIGPFIFNFESHLQGLNAAISATHTVATTPVPFAYMTHLRSITVMFLACVPFVYSVIYKWWCLIICFYVGFAYFGIESVSEEVESPFGIDYNDLPLDLYNQDIRDLLNEFPEFMPNRSALLNHVVPSEDKPLETVKAVVVDKANVDTADLKKSNSSSSDTL